MNKFLIARGIVQEVTRCLPGATITAPPRERAVVSMITEQERLAQFEHSRDFHARRAAESSAPGMDYDEDLSEGFRLKYG